MFFFCSHEKICLYPILSSMLCGRCTNDTNFPIMLNSVSVSFFLSLHYGDRKLFNPLAEVDISTYTTQNLKPFFAKKFLSDLCLYLLWVFFLAPSSNKLTSLFFLPLIDLFQ